MPSFSPSGKSPRKISPSQEQYVEAIADLLTRDKVCSVSDIAAQVQVSRPAVSRAVRELSEQEIVTHKAYGYVDLTEKGRMIADRLTIRHEALYAFLKDVLFFEDDWADQEACRLEHQVDDAMVERLNGLSDLVKSDGTLTEKLKQVMKKLD